jgi:hypothetical protein
MGKRANRGCVAVGARVVARQPGATIAIGADGFEGEEIEQVADRLTDLGYLRVVRAGHYSLTTKGRELLSDGLEQTHVTDAKPRSIGTTIGLAVVIVILVLSAWFLV